MIPTQGGRGGRHGASAPVRSGYLKAAGDARTHSAAERAASGAFETNATSSTRDRPVSPSSALATSATPRGPGEPATDCSPRRGEDKWMRDVRWRQCGRARTAVQGAGGAGVAASSAGEVTIASARARRSKQVPGEFRSVQVVDRAQPSSAAAGVRSDRSRRLSPVDLGLKEGRGIQTMLVGERRRSPRAAAVRRRKAS